MLKGVTAAIAREAYVPGVQPPNLCCVGLVRPFHAPAKQSHDFLAPSDDIITALSLHDSDALGPDLHTAAEMRPTTDQTQAQRQIHKKESVFYKSNKYER